MSCPLHVQKILRNPLSFSNSAIIVVASNSALRQIYNAQRKHQLVPRRRLGNVAGYHKSSNSQSDHPISSGKRRPGQDSSQHPRVGSHGRACPPTYGHSGAEARESSWLEPTEAHADAQLLCSDNDVESWTATKCHKLFNRQQDKRKAAGLDTNGGIMPLRPKTTASNRSEEMPRIQDHARTRATLHRMNIGGSASRDRSYHTKGSLVHTSARDVGPKREPWQVQKAALLEKFGAPGWSPRKRLSPDSLEGIRALHAQFPDKYSTPVLADQFKVSPEAMRRILKSKWRPNYEEEDKRRVRWNKRGINIWGQMNELGIKPPRKWRDQGVGKVYEHTSAKSKGLEVVLREATHRLRLENGHRSLSTAPIVGSDSTHSTPLAERFL